MSPRRVRPYAAAIYGKIYVMGLNIGLWGTEVCVDNSVLGEVLDPLLNEWKPLPTIPEKGNYLDVDTHAVINGGKQQKWFSEPVKGLERTGVSPPSWDKNGYGSPESNCPKAFLVHIGNGKLCLVWYLEYERNPMEVHCTKFRISKHGDGEEEHRLHAIIESSVVNTIDNADDVEDCLAL
ncbi:hypothetical protein F0562_015753 [Nyssa sinensis]|uniref:Uncharacterized protein n=1 Tax=Nyssa sinensis TaxID=561372 RepID=A0A5J4ZKP3_9ASTE|nr:hypothetical protein F0562_015753 [Nyssa sinensis]